MARKPEDLWNLHSRVASYVMPSKKLCHTLTQKPVDKAAVLKILSDISPNPKIRKKKDYYFFGAAFIAETEPENRLNPLHANWHCRFVYCADEFHRLLNELKPEQAANFDLSKATAIAVDFRQVFAKCTLQRLKAEVLAAIDLMTAVRSGNGPVSQREAIAKRQIPTAGDTDAALPSDYVTLSQMASNAGKSKRSLRGLVTRGVLPSPTIKGSKSERDQWLWDHVEPILERHRKTSESISVPELAKEWGVSTGKIYTLIRNCELRAINHSIGQGKRPRWSILRSAIEEFLQTRATVPAAVKPTGKQHRRKSDGVTNYF